MLVFGIRIHKDLLLRKVSKVFTHDHGDRADETRYLTIRPKRSRLLVLLELYRYTRTTVADFLTRLEPHDSAYCEEKPTGFKDMFHDMFVH